MTNMKALIKINWRNGEERSAFKNELKTYRKAMKIRSVWEKIKWFIGIFIIQFGVVILLYGPCAFLLFLWLKTRNKNRSLSYFKNVSMDPR